MQAMPRVRQFDSTVSFLKDPYRFISREARLLHSDIFEARLMLKKTICMTGKEAAELFTDPALFERKRSQPGVVKATLLGKGGVQGLDGEAHLHRKNLFMSFVTNDNMEDLTEIFSGWLDVYIDRWISEDTVSLYEEFQEILTRTVFMWAGLDLPHENVKERTEELTHMFDSAATGKHLMSRLSRKKSQAWLQALVKEIREGKHPELAGRPVSVISLFRDYQGNELSPEVAAVEILNLLRPVVAVSLYLVFCLHALHLDPESRRRIKAQESGFLDNFVNEVRRFYPFFPALNARVKQDFKWGRLLFKKGTKVMLDLYGINHDERYWERAGEFRPDRFNNWKGNLYEFVPQGVGDHFMNHRCPGEFFTIELMRKTIMHFSSKIIYDVPAQNLAPDMSRLPAVPRDHFIISQVRRQVAIDEFVIRL